MPIASRNSPSTFDGLYEQLNAAQKSAVDAIEGPVLVIAGPGTGKTTVLTLRIAHILQATDTSPDSILALTFTESGAYAMRRKLVDIIGPAAYRVNIHTFHGFASQLIERYPDYFPRIIGSSIITEAEQVRIVESIVQSKQIKLLRPYGDQAYYINPILREIQVLKRENVSPADLAESVEQDAAALKEAVKSAAGGEKLSPAEQEKQAKRVEKNRELAHAYARYEEELSAAKKYDFDDMLLELIRAMEEYPDFKLIVQEQYQYILADEHQDANAAQNRILELLCDFHDAPNLFIVGDDKQAIYRFQGASLENFLYFSKKYPSALVIDLEHNYRSHQRILDASHSLISRNPGIPGRERTRLISLVLGGSPICTLEFPTVGDELECIARLVGKLVSQGKKPDDIALLYRDNRHAAPLSAMLAAQGIPHRIESDHDVLGDPDVVKILALTRAVDDLSNSQALAAALFLPELGCDPAEVAEACARASRERLPLHSALKKLDASDPLKQAYKRLAAWAGEAQTLPFPDFLQKLIQETGMLAAIISAPDSLERLNSVQSFYDYVAAAARAARTFRLRDFMDHVELIREHGIAAKRAHAEHMKGVRLMTAHRSKGLEFGHVFIIHAVDGVWGNRSSRTLFTVPVIEHARSAGRIEDERRLFYVAMTRARESVTVSYARSDGVRETIPSQFISEIDPALVSHEKMDINAAPLRTAELFQPPQVTVSVSILEPAFVRSKFLAQPLSVTHLNNYISCAWKYFFVNLIRIPQAENRHQMYGTAMHAALRTFFEAYREERDLPQKQLVELFAHHLAQQPLSAGDREDALEKGKQALAGYYTTYKGLWNRQLLTEYALRGAEIRLDGDTRLELTGKLDKIELLDGQSVTVVDYKTGKPKSRNDIEGKTKTSDGNYMRQLAFYKLLLDSDRTYNMKYGEIDFIEPNERGKYKKERFEVADEAVEKVKQEIVDMAMDMITLTFMERGCGEKNCEYCRLGSMLKRS